MEEKLKILLAELEEQKNQILELHQKIETKVKEFEKNLDNEDLRDSLAYKLHNLYNAYEELFKIVAEFFENQIEERTKYYTVLLKRMLLNLEGIRPALISKESFKILDELRAFRHLFRHAYSYELDSERVLKLAQKVYHLKPFFMRDFKEFLKKIIPQSLEQG
ncbi:MAG: hypothetical protein NZ530_07810 [Thermodesulfobacteriaceae bacterium]|nr:hypothetical protein [Thermodesulfobacteriaceae bacterium]